LPAGHSFGHWIVNGTAITGNSITITENITVTAHFIPDVIIIPEFGVTVDYGTADVENPVAVGTPVTLTPTIPAGQNFNGWEVISPESFSFTGNSFNMPNHDVHVRATFITPPIGTHPVTVIGGTVEGESYAFAPETTVTIIANNPAPAGQVFSHWQVNAGGVTLASTSNETTTFVMPNNAVEVEAIFVPTPANHFRLTVIYGTSDVENPNLVPFGTPVTLTYTPREGYDFNGWITRTTGFTVPQSGMFLMPSQDVTVEADFAPTPLGFHQLTVLGGGTANVANPVQQGTPVTLTPETREGFTFSHWIVDEPYTFTFTGSEFNMPGHNVTVSQSI